MKYLRLTHSFRNLPVVQDARLAVAILEQEVTCSKLPMTEA